MTDLDATHDPQLRSWVASAHAPATDFPLQNLPHGVFRRRGGREAWRGGVAIGQEVLDLRAVLDAGLLDRSDSLLLDAAHAAAAPTLNAFMALGRAHARRLRSALSQLLREGHARQPETAACLVPQDTVEMRLPADVGDYTDFFTSADHMLHMGRLFQPDRPLLPQFTSLPIAYHGRASTVTVSPSGPERPWGQSRGDGQARFAPTAMLDFELELAAWVGPGNPLGQPVALQDAPEHLFGIGLLNDWSARDVQGWEAVPLGPFQSKNFLTTVSPWVVTMDALAPFRCPVRRDAGDPPLLPYLQPAAHAAPLGLDLVLEAWLQPAGGAPQLITRTRSAHGHWSFAQMLTHHTVNGCALRPGDLLGSGTQSGPGPQERGCLMEITSAGREPLQLQGGGLRRQLEDGDTLILRGHAERPGAVRIGLGECRGTVRPARELVR